MDTISLSKNNQLFWLGRYAERVYQNVVLVRDVEDKLLDDISVDINDYCTKLGILTTFDSTEDFCKRFAYDRSFPSSILYTADVMLGNGMVLREMLGSQTLSYLQMATSALEEASLSSASEIRLQWVLDDIMAFRGCYGDAIDSEAIRNTIKSGASVERVSTYLRFEASDAALVRELTRLIGRLEKTHLTYNEACYKLIQEYINSEETHPNRAHLLNSVETLFVI